MKRYKTRALWLVGLVLSAFVGFQAFQYAWPKLTLLNPTYAAGHFRQMDQAFPARVIRKSEQPMTLASARQPLDLSYEHEGVTRSLDSFLERSDTTTPDRLFLQPGSIDADWGYQYQWWIPRGGEGDFSAIGIYGQFIYVNPAANLVIVKTSADMNFKPHEYEAIQAFRAIATALGK